MFSVQFDGEAIDEVGILSEFWPKIHDRFPRHEKHPPVMPAAESFAVPPPPPELQVQMLPMPPAQRYWFLSEDGTRIVQVQPDRLIFNWRRVVGDEPYPHFEALAPAFEDVLETFVSCESVTIGSSDVAWIELQYINPIPVPVDEGGAATHGQLARILNFLDRDPPRTVLPPVEDTQLQQRFRIDDEGLSIGRLYLTAVPAFKNANPTPVYVVTLLARGRPGPGEIREGVQAFLDRAHTLIVEGFKEVTTPEMHQEWGAR